MESLNQKITEVRDALLGADASVADSFSRVFDQFLDLIQTDTLVRASKRFKDKRVRLLLEGLARAHTNQSTVVLTHFQMLRHAPSGMVHGLFFADGQPATYFYFQREQQGLAAIVGEHPTTHFYRMTLAELPDAANLN